MEWIFLVALGIHIVSGFLCSRIALDMNRRPESWFLQGRCWASWVLYS